MSQPQTRKTLESGPCTKPVTAQDRHTTGNVAGESRSQVGVGVGSIVPKINKKDGNRDATSEVGWYVPLSWVLGEREFHFVEP